jgi:hypothetical protein
MSLSDTIDSTKRSEISLTQIEVGIVKLACKDGLSKKHAYCKIFSFEDLPGGKFSFQQHTK